MLDHGFCKPTPVSLPNLIIQHLISPSISSSTNPSPLLPLVHALALVPQAVWFTAHPSGPSSFITEHTSTLRLRKILSAVQILIEVIHSTSIVFVWYRTLCCCLVHYSLMNFLAIILSEKTPHPKACTQNDKTQIFIR